MQRLATKRINEMYNDLLKELRGGKWQPIELEILAIKRYLDELAEQGLSKADQAD